MSSHKFLFDRFSVADAYLTTILNWAPSSGINLAQWSAVAAYHERMLKRPSIAQAFGEEWALYKGERARHARN